MRGHHPSFSIAFRTHHESFSSTMSEQSATMTDEVVDIISSSMSSRILQDDATQQIPETSFEFYSDAILGTAFLVTAIVAAKRCVSPTPADGAARGDDMASLLILINFSCLLFYMRWEMSERFIDGCW